MADASYVFREHPGAPGAPVLFLFHGTGGDENQFLDLGRQLLPQARLIGVRGDVSEHGALRYFRRTGEGVYDMDDLRLRTEKLADFVRGQLEGQAHGPVIGLGYSNGANILASVMFYSPDLFEAGVLLHPLIPFEPPKAEGLAGKSVLITAGRRDPICPPQLTQDLADYFEGQATDTVLSWHDGGHEIRQEELTAILQFLAPYRQA